MYAGPATQFLSSWLPHSYFYRWGRRLRAIGCVPELGRYKFTWLRLQSLQRGSVSSGGNGRDNATSRHSQAYFFPSLEHLSLSGKQLDKLGWKVHTWGALITPEKWESEVSLDCPILSDKTTCFQPNVPQRPAQRKIWTWLWASNWRCQEAGMVSQRSTGLHRPMTFINTSCILFLARLTETGRTLLWVLLSTGGIKP